MGKSSKKSDSKVEAARSSSKNPLKKGKRDAEHDLDIQLNPKKQKTELIAAMQKENAEKKVETSSSDSSDSSDSEDEQKQVVVTDKSDAKNGSLKAKAESSSSEDESSSDEESALEVKQPASLKKAKAESSSSEDESSSDEEPAPAMKQHVPVITALKKAKAASSSSEDESSSDEQSLPALKQPAVLKKAKADSSSAADESSSDEESAPLKKQSAAPKKAKVESSSSEDESSSDEEPELLKKQPVVVKTAVKDSSSSDDESEDEKEPGTKKLSDSAKSKPISSSDSSEEDSDDEENDDEKPPKKKVKISPTQTSEQESSSEESDEDESEDEKVTPKKKDSDIVMVEAEHKSNAKQTPNSQTQGGSKTLFVGNLSYQIERSDVENFFKEAGEVVDVRFGLNGDGSFRGFGHVKFASAEAAENALKLNGKTLLGRDVRLDLAQEKASDNTPRSSNASGRNYQSSGKGGGSQSRTIFVSRFNSSLGEPEIKDALRDHFSTCGEITRIVVPVDRETGSVKGIAFIDLKDGFDKALEMSGSEIGGWSIVVNEAKPRGDNHGGDDGGRFSSGKNGGGRTSRGRGRDGGGRFSRGRDGGGRFSSGRGRGRTPSKPSVIASSQGKKTLFDDE